MSNIHPILNLKNKYKCIKEVSVNYTDKLVITVSFHNPEMLTYGMFGLVYQTLKHNIHAHDKKWAVVHKHGERYLEFTAKDKAEETKC